MSKSEDRARFVWVGCVGVLALCAWGPLWGQTSSSAVWQEVDEGLLAGVPGERWVVPDRYRTVALDSAALFERLDRAPLEGSPEASRIEAILELPMPDGSYQRFRIEQSPILEPGLAALYPEVRTYSGVGLDDPSATARLGWTRAGFHAIVLSAERTVYMDRYRIGDLTHYVVYDKRDYRKPGASRGVCLVESESAGPEEGPLGPVGESVPLQGGTRRTYRLAQAANFEYTQFHSGGLPNVPSKQAAIENGIIPTINRVNAIYERDLAVRMILIANLEDIVWDQPADPYVNEDGTSMLAANQSTLDSIVGNANYDIGHVFSTGGGGVAGLGVVCDNAQVPLNQKAWGVTGLPAPIGDPFDVDFVAHEMGHQFDANHSFNGNAGNCSGGNRNAGTAYEVGSGSTIMGYAGICAAQDLQPHSDPYFHIISLVEIGGYIGAGRAHNCAGKISTGNTLPVVDAGQDFTIPSRTPFILTATASDADGDLLTYTWEEFDLGAANAGTSDNGSSPIVRSFAPVTSPSRIIPKLSDLLGNTTSYGELLPTTTRTMRFRVTVRDQRPGGGATAYDERNVSVRGTQGPFLVTEPDGGELWTGGESQPVTWNVAGTTAAPINAASVDILLSTDGGITFPTVLATGVPNDGSQDVIAPNLATTTARVMVRGSGNIFFDISNAVFEIEPGSGPPIVVPDLAATAFNHPVFIDVLANDSDPDNDPLSLFFVQSPTDAGGTARMDNRGTPDTTDDRVRYTPPAGFSGDDTFFYVARAGVDSGSAVVTVEVSPFCPPTPTGTFLDTLETGAPGWTVDTPLNRLPSPTWSVEPDTGAQSPTRSFRSDASAPDLKDDRLIAPPQDLSDTSRLIFWHRFVFESGFDGGVLEVSTDGGANWVDVRDGGGTFVQGAYNDTISTSFGSPISGRDAWSGQSESPDAMSRVEVNLSAYEGENVLVRWRLALDNGALTTGVAWWVDDVQFTNLLEPQICPPPGIPGSVPDSDAVPGVPLTVSKSQTTPGDLDLNWGSSCALGATDYSVHEGLIGFWYTHTYKTCSTSGAQSATLTPGAGNNYYVVVPLTATDEGSYGLSSDGERPRSLSVCRSAADATSCP